MPAKAPAVLSPDRLAEALAILVIDVIAALDLRDRQGAMERIANRLDGQARTSGGGDAAAMLGAIGGALIQLGC